MHLGVIPFHTRVRLSSSQDTTRPHAAPGGATKTHPGALIVVLALDTTGPHAAPGGTTKSHPGALIVVSGHYRATCCTWGCHQNTPGCAHRRLRTLQGHMLHLGVQPKYTRVHLSSSQDTTGPHAAPGGTTKTHPGALIVVLSQDTTGPHAAPRGTTKSHPGALTIVLSQDTTRSHAAPRGATKTHPSALIVFPDSFKVTCCTWGYNQNTPGCAHRRLRTLQGHMLHLGVQPKYTRVRLPSSQDTTGPHAAPGGTTKTHPGALIVVSGHYKATCRTWGCHQNTPGCNFAGGSESVSVST